MARRSESKRGSDKDSLQQLHLWQFQAVRDLLVVASAGGILWLGYALRAVTVPLLVALLLAYLFEPLVARVSRHRRFSRPMVVGGLLTTVGLLVLGGVAVVVPVTVTQTAGLVRDYQGGQIRKTAETLAEFLPEIWRERTDVLIEYLPEGDQAEVAGPDPAAPDDPTRRGGFVSAGRSPQGLPGSGAAWLSYRLGRYRRPVLLAPGEAGRGLEAGKLGDAL